jgi:hypothetical protein
MRLCGYFSFFLSDADSSSTLDLQVYAHRIGRDDHIGGIFERVDTLLEQGSTGS